MKHIATIRHSELFPGERDSDPSDFVSRHAARAVITNDEGNVALLFVSHYNFHKLPGGGVEVSEDVYATLERELLEEVGSRFSACCKRSIIGSGISPEYALKTTRIALLLMDFHKQRRYTIA